ncbi:site-2 protease family protein [Paludifilum halophilum]|uniref:Peptidase M50 domain-containing protein n=1 Tax=Paludifilum halophilum TaxID=1642702 RepID=A0A235B2P2_9BACL|nr:site-2 protease family protein [Paludifilum halophilum]OYD06576.1 hypothetical protein CHM34_15905 [Paludifilum halophilum]
MEGSFDKQKKRGSWGWLGGLGALVISGLKYIPSLLKLGKAGGTLWSMLLMVGGYALIFPWSFSIGLVVMIFIHEMGHIWAAKRKGLPVSAPAFIPFLGALITMKRQPRDAVTEAYIAYGGPLVGSLGALACYGLAVVSEYEVLYAVALIGFILNLFNLLPIHPLDGGRIVTAISRWFWAVGLVAGLVLILYTFNPILILVWLLFAFQLWDSFVSRKESRERSFRVDADVDPERFRWAGIMLPSEGHFRKLPFLQYCSLEGKEHCCDIFYPGIGRIHRVTGYTGLFRNFQLSQTEVFTRQDGTPRVRMRLEAQYEPGTDEAMLRKDEAYYRVSAKTRLAFGAAYLGLAVFLIYMLVILGRFSLNGSMVVS